jgi:UDPglucose 6-dehydrogenase
MARVVVVGAGIVGTAAGVGLSRGGHDVTFVDESAARVEALRADGFDAGVAIELTGDAAVVLLCVPTPVRDGRHDLTSLESAVRAIGAALRDADTHVVHTLVVRSTVPPGTCDTVVQPLVEAVSGCRGGEEFLVAACPEFLREASALDDFLAPRVTVIGSRHPRALDALVALFRPLGGEIMTTANPRAVELVKCMQNAWNATKISFWNEAWQLACAIDVDAEFVADAVALAAEGSYNPAYGIRGGTAFGGACIEKDTQGLAGFASSIGVPTSLLDAVLAVNAEMRALASPANG